MKILWISIIAILTLGSCYYRVEEEIYPSVACDTENTSYSGHVLPILQEHCYLCHSQLVNTGNITLEGYDNLKEVVDNGRILGAIKHEPGFRPMPDGMAQLQECEIARIEAWINDGAPNN